MWLGAVLHASLPASSAEHDLRWPEERGIPGVRPIRRVTRHDLIADTHLGGGAKRRQVRSHPSDLAGRIGPHNGRLAATGTPSRGTEANTTTRAAAASASPHSSDGRDTPTAFEGLSSRVMKSKPFYC